VGVEWNACTVISFQFHSRVRYLSTYYICPSACMMSWIRQRVKIQSLHTCMPCLILPRTVLKLVGEDRCFFRSCSYFNDRTRQGEVIEQKYAMQS
jgi:hypothetical protein